MLRRELVDTTRGRIVSLLRGGGRTADDIARHLRLTGSAVRAQMTAMEADGVVRRVGTRAGTTRPFHVFELTAHIEQLLSRAYVPLLAQLIDVFAEALPTDQLEALLRETGRRLAQALAPAPIRPRRLAARAQAVSDILNEQLGAMTRLERGSEITIRADGCPLAALTGKHPGICRVMEVVVSDLLETRVQECCERRQRPACCFVVRADCEV